MAVSVAEATGRMAADDAADFGDPAALAVNTDTEEPDTSQERQASQTWGELEQQPESGSSSLELLDPLDPLDSTPAAPLATREVIGQYKDMVYRIALTHTLCQSDADDVFQDVFLAYHRRQPVFATEGARKGWLITATLNCARHQASTSWRTSVVPLRPEDAERLAAPATFTFQTETQDELFRALTQLPEQYRSVLHLFYFEDMSIAQIAYLLGERDGAVKMRLSRAREMMRSSFLGGLPDE